MQNRAPFMARTSFLWCMLVALLCSAAVFALAQPAAAEKQIPATPAQSSMSMLPHLEWLLDSTGNLTVDDLGKPQQQMAFRPLKLQDLPREAGTVWLRFTLAGRPSEVRPATMLLDMGDGVPDTPTLFVPKHNLLTGITEWQTFAPSQRTVFLMPETRQEPVTAYIRMDGLPGLWFSPMLRTPHNAATALERLARPAVIVALGVIMLLCLLRGLTERGEWRIWTSLYTAAALVHAVWGVPATSKGHVDMMNMAAVLAPGVGLMILPHVGRHLLRTRQTSRAIDLQLFLLSLPGAALALLPLVPGYSWTTRFLDLWPAGTLLLVPTTLGAWLCGLPGARRFLLGCLLPPLGVAVGILGMGTAIPAPLLGTAPLWGLALGALLIAGTAAPVEHRAADGQAAAAMPTAQDLVDEDPNLRIVSPEELTQGGGASPTGEALDDSQALALEESLRGPMDDLLRDGAALAQCALPPVARQLADNMVQSAHRMATLMAGGPSQSAAGRVREDVVFDLQEVLRQAHDAISAVADSKNIALSWFMPPHLGQRYRGDAAQLDNVLRLLLESAVRATSRGAVQLAVRRVPESVNPGHLLFSVTDSGSGVPPEDRSSVALARAWELAGVNRGFLGVECSPHGATISFTLHLEPAGVDMTADAEEAQGLAAVPHPGIIVVEDSPGERQLLAFFLEGLGATVVEARSTEEAVDLYMDRPAQLLIFDGDLSPAALHAAVQRVRTFENAEGNTPAMIMGLSSNDAQWEVLRQAGFTHALPKPITRSGLRSTVCQLLPQCAAQESLTPDMDMSQNLPSLSLDGEPEVPATMGAVGAGALDDMALSMGGTADVAASAPMRPDALPTTLPPSLPDTLEDDEDVIDTGMPLLEMDSQPASVPTPASVATPAMRAVSAPTPDLLPAPVSERGDAGNAPSSLPDLFPSDAELTAPAHVPTAQAVESAASMQLLPDMPLPHSTLAHSDSLEPAAQGGGLELSPVYETPEALRAPAAGKSHADYLTSLLDGDDDLIRHDQKGETPVADMTADAPEAHMAQAVREGAEEARRGDAFAEPVPAPVVGVKVDILARAKEKPQQTSQPLTSSQPLHAFDEVPAGTALFVSDAAPVQSSSPIVPAAPTEPTVPAAPTAAPQPDVASAPQPVAMSAVTDHVSTSSVSVEWVGDPRPVGSDPMGSDPIGEVAPVSSPLRMEAEEPTPPAPGSAVEWVGEPRPVGTPTPSLAMENTPAPPASSPLKVSVTPSVSAPVIGAGVARDAAMEWVGEPRPIERPSERPVVPPVESPVETQAGRGNESSTELHTELGAELEPEAQIEPAVEGDAAPSTDAGAELPVEFPAEPLVESSVESPVAEPVEQPAVEEPAPAAAPAPAAQEDFVPLSMDPEDSGEPAPRQSREERAADRARLTLLPQSTPLMDFIIADPEPMAAVPPTPEAALQPAEAAPASTTELSAKASTEPPTESSVELSAEPPAETKSGPRVITTPKASSSVRINVTSAKVVRPAEPASNVSVVTSRAVSEASTPAPESATTAAQDVSAPVAQEVQTSATPQADVAPHAQAARKAAAAPEDASAAPEDAAAAKAEAPEAANYLDEEDSVLFSSVTLGSAADASALAGSPLEPLQHAPSAPSGQRSPSGMTVGAAMPRASYGSVGEPMPITKPDANPAPSAASGPSASSKELPLTRLLEYFDQAVQHARQSFENKDPEGVHEGASYIARQADKVGLRTLARMARCVADAGKAKDMDAVKDLLPELESTVERNRIALGG